MASRSWSLQSAAGPPENLLSGLKISMSDSGLYQTSSRSDKMKKHWGTNDSSKPDMILSVLLIRHHRAIGNQGKALKGLIGFLSAL